MRDSIYTIPISEVFEPKCGCPICSISDTLESRCIEYIMGAAMMEPDIRQETNRLGFCKTHFDIMMKCKNRLSLALMLQSLLIELPQNVGNKKASVSGMFSRKKDDKVEKTCFVCSKIDWAKERMFSTIVNMYEQNAEFRQLYKEQEYLCLPHYEELTSFAKSKMNKKTTPEFMAISEELFKRQLDILSKDVSHYCSMFDYRNTSPDADWGNSKDSIERAIYFLTSRKTD